MTIAPPPLGRRLFSQQKDGWMTAHFVFNLIASSAGFALGGVFLKRYADAGAWHDLGVAFAIFACSNLLYAHVLAKGLGQGAVLSSMAHLLLMSAGGVLIFGERMGPMHVAGLVSALVTIWLFTLASQITA
jgi:drug/metabolite transporter (DMT)-like permease